MTGAAPDWLLRFLTVRSGFVASPRRRRRHPQLPVLCHPRSHRRRPPRLPLHLQDEG